MFDAADQWGRVIDAFVVERLRVGMKYNMGPIENARNFEVSRLASLINVHLMASEDRVFGDGLLRETSFLDGARVPMADRMSVSGLAI
eukprot:6503279-Pyramimonas_sp.AAC.1